MSRIGLDIDGVLTNIEKYQLDYGEKFFKDKYNMDVVNENGFDIKEIFNCTDKQFREFWTKYLLKYSISEPAREGIAEQISQIKKDGNTIHIITQREFATRDDKLGKLMRFIVEEWLKANHIEYDTITYCDKDKIEAIKKHKIDTMIEDNPKNCEEISKIIDVICMDARSNRQCNNENIYRITDVNELNNKLKEINEHNIKKMTTDFIGPLSGKASIDKPWKRKYYVKSQTNIEIPQKTIYEYMWDCSKDKAYMEAIGYFGRNFTFEEFNQKIDECAKAFIEKGVKEDDIITICMPNTPEGLIAFYAVNKIGAVADMIHPLSSADEIKDYVNDSKSKFMIMMDICYDKAKQILPQTNLENVIVASAKDSMPLPLKIAYTLAVAKSNNYYKEKPIDKFEDWDNFIKDGKRIEKVKTITFTPNKLSVMLHTGGSTGKSKAVEASNENFNANVEQLKSSIPHYIEGSKLLAVTPIFHGFGLADCIHTALSANSKVVLMPQFDEKTFAKNIIKEDINFILGVPTLFASMTKNKLLHNKKLKSLKVLISGGDNLPKDIEDLVNKFLEEHEAPNSLYKGLGMTECIAATAFTCDGTNEKSSVGIPLPLNNFKIVKPGTTEEVDYNEAGEICVNGPTVMMKYHNNIEETNMIMKEHDDGKVWLHSGDIGYMTEDGILYYKERIKRIIISSGYNIYPNQIEEVVKEHEAIETCAVVGVPHPYKVNVPKVFMTLKDGYKPTEQLKDEVHNLCKEHLSKFSLPKEYEIIKELPKTKLLKIDYKQLEHEEIEKYYSRLEKQNNENQLNQTSGEKIKSLKISKGGNY